MTTIPFTRMAVSLSGGGYRATTFHLGALSLLDAIDLEPGNSLIIDEDRRAGGATLLENVHILSTISGGTLTGIMYALKLSQKEQFKDCYYKLYDLLEGDKLVEHALKKLNTPGNWKNKYKNRNVINSFAEVYHEDFYDEATFGDLYKDLDSHLTDVIFGASEFTAGLQYRFQESSKGLFGADNLLLPKTVSERIRLADSAASSSCFPGGFEPMTMPTDFSNGPHSRVEEWWSKKKIDFEKEVTIAIERAEQANATAEAAAMGKSDLAASISAALKKEIHATRAAEKAAKKARKAGAKALKISTAAEGPMATEKTSTREKAAAAKEHSKKLALEAQKASEEAATVSAQAPELAAVLAKAIRASQSADDAVATAKKVAAKAKRKVKSTAKKAAKAAVLAEEEMEKSRQELHAALNAPTPNDHERFKMAEKTAARAEKMAEEAAKAATATAAARADLALIAAEQVVAAATAAQKAATAVLNAPEKAPALAQAITAALKASEKATASVLLAKESTTASAEATTQVHQCNKAATLAENASTKMATYWIDKAYASKDSEVKKSRKAKVRKKDAEIVPAKTTAKEKAIAAATTVQEETNRVLALARKAAGSLEARSPALTKEIDALVTAATQAVKSAEIAEEASALARSDKPYHPTTAIMDGGILDNQGVRGVVMAEKRYAKEGKLPPYIGTFIISDVSGKTMAPYTVPAFEHSSLKDLFTLKRINIVATVLFLGIVALLIFRENPTWGIVLASVVLTVLGLWFGAFLWIKSIFVARVSDTFAGDELPEITRDLKILINTPLYIIIHLIKFRASSALKMITDVFLRRIRQLQLHGLFKNPNWNYRVVSNNIYALKGADKLTLELKRVIAAANNMPTTLWFSQKEREENALDDLIACGQLTLCSNLVNYVRGLKTGSNKERVWDSLSEKQQQEIDAILDTLESYWQKFRVDPHWLIDQYGAEREQHEADKEKRVVLGFA